MAVRLPKELQKEIRETIFHLADEHGYAYRGRIENGVFMTSLISDPRIGGRLSEYMPKSDIKTYIKDAVLNRYTKEIINRNLTGTNSTSVVNLVYQEEATEISTKGPIHICANDKMIFIICDGTVTKWESALRRSLETASRLTNSNNKQVKICLRLASLGPSTARGDKDLIRKGLLFIGAEVVFC